MSPEDNVLKTTRTKKNQQQWNTLSSAFRATALEMMLETTFGLDFLNIHSPLVKLFQFYLKTTTTIIQDNKS